LHGSRIARIQAVFRAFGSWRVYSEVMSGAQLWLVLLAGVGVVVVSVRTPAGMAYPGGFPPAQDTGSFLYAVNCAPCHQLSGLGLGDTIPPLAGSEWVTGGEARLVRVMLGGLTGEIEVQGEIFKGAMPGWGPLLDDNQISAIATHIRRSWGNKAAPVNANVVAQLRKSMGDRKSPWTAEELRRIGGSR
jgi:mono/diheme cytochrome c family protein